MPARKAQNSCMLNSLVVQPKSAAALADLGFNAQQGEMLFLLLRLPGAAAHALEQADYGFKRFPYPQVDLLDDPLNKHQEATV